jgi:UDP-N-acetylmuramate--alanine ligase
VPDPPVSDRRGPVVDLTAPRRVHVVGVGGAGMSGIATVLAAMGHTVTGSDQADSSGLQRQRERGIAVTVGHAAANVGSAEFVTASTAVPATNPELAEASRQGIPVLRRAEILAAICATRRTLAVAGTKGKTTTTAMLASILIGAGWDPSFLVGGDLPGVGGGARWSAASEWLVVEADESDGTFLELPAESVVVTNVEADHLDRYGSMAALKAAFATFIGQAPGRRVVGVDVAEAAEVVAAMDVPVRTYGTTAGVDVRITDVRSGRDRTTFNVVRGGRPLGPVDLAMPGLHNARNACGALALALELGVTFEVAAAALAGYRGVARRFDWRGERAGITYVDDYAHLPSALSAVLATARRGGWGRIVAVFQPHRYTRTEALHAEFGPVFADADVVVVGGIYGAGEEPLPGVTGELVAEAVRTSCPQVELHYVPERAELAAAVASLLRPGDLCLTLGAGDVTTLAAELLGRSEP